MKISVTKQNINSAKAGAEQITPIELAVLDLEMFEEVKIHPVAEGKFSIYIDDMDMVLPTKANKALVKFQETQEMRPFSFELNLEAEMNVPSGEFEMLDFEESFDYGFDLDFA